MNKYIINNNGDTSYKIDIKKNYIIISKSRYDYLHKKHYDKILTLAKNDISNIIISSTNTKLDTNNVGALLIQLSKNPSRFIYIGVEIYEFELKHNYSKNIILQIQKCEYTTLYPYLIANNTYYLLEEGVYITNIPKKYQKCPYDYYYNKKTNNHKYIKKNIL